MPEGVDTSIYKNQQNPLGTLTNVYGILNAAESNRLLQTANQQRQLELQQGQANDLLTSVSPLANKPGLTQAEVLGTLADRARQLGIADHNIYNIAAKRYQGADWQKNLKIDAIRSLGPSGLTQRQEVMDPRTMRRESLPVAATIGTQFPTAPGPGEPEIATAAAGNITNMASVANDAPNQKALLENLNDLSAEAVSGPSSDWEKRANALIQRLIPGFKFTLTPEQLGKSEEYGKISEQLAGQQATAAHATNAFLTNAYNTNPGLYLSKIGRQGITHMLQGNVDSIVAKNNAWDAYANGEVDGIRHSPAEFNTWNRKFNLDFNPRVFQYARMTPEERSGFRSALPKGQQKKFFEQIQQYQKNGWIDLGG